MKTFLTLFVLLFSSSVLAEVYYCSEEDHVGFKKKENKKITEFFLRKFTINIDIKNNIVLTDADESYIGYADFVPKECITYFENEIYCISNMGAAFSFNKNTNNFKLSKILNTDNNLDDDSISYGKCSKF